MTPERAAEIGSALYSAEQTRSQIALISQANPGMTLDDAYAVQDAFVKAKKDAGAVQRGWKIGLTSKAMRDALKIDIPDSGVLFDDMFFDDGATVPADRFIQPRIEAEIAFVMRNDLIGPNVTAWDAMAATDYILPAIEILDTRVIRQDPETGALRKITDTIADNAANAGIALGGRPISVDDVDMRWIGAIVSRNAEVEETGLGAGVLNQPAQGIAWLANRLSSYGDALRAGDVVLSGSFVRPVECPHGSTVLADFGDFGSVSLHFA